jgi:hypothetical protein
MAKSDPLVSKRALAVSQAHAAKEYYAKAAFGAGKLRA